MTSDYKTDGVRRWVVRSDQPPLPWLPSFTNTSLNILLDIFHKYCSTENNACLLPASQTGIRTRDLGRGVCESGENSYRENTEQAKLVSFKRTHFLFCLNHLKKYKITG